VTLAREIGHALRRARELGALTLRQGPEASRGTLPPTSLASYERGERTISVARLIRLAAVYRIPGGASRG
jgi:transcriptional regulator with XRE-family HTH domain